MFEKNYEINEKNFLGHELIGLKAKSENVKGIVWFETKNLIEIKTSKGIVKMEKKSKEFLFELPDKTIVKVKGKNLSGRSEERTKIWSKKFAKGGC